MPRLLRPVDEVFTVAEVAVLLKVSRATVYAMVEGGMLTHFRVSNSIRMRRDALEKIVLKDR